MFSDFDRRSLLLARVHGRLGERFEPPPSIERGALAQGRLRVNGGEHG
jgi:hypothetical protein